MSIGKNIIIAGLGLGLVLLAACGGGSGGSVSSGGGSSSSSSASSTSSSSSSSSSSSASSSSSSSASTSSAEPTDGALTQVSGYGSNPGQLDMFVYKPAGLTANRPVVVFLHGCGSQASQYDNETGWAKWADQMKFILIFPQATVAPDGCFQYYSAAHQMTNAGEPLSVIQMVNWVQSHYNTDSKRVFVTGFSAGGAMTNVMLATYPDIFTAGAPVAGVPYKCTEGASGLDNCLKGNVSLTAQQWGDKVRAARPGYSGPWPRVSIWQGVDDGVVAPINATWTMEQWTNVHGLTQTPQTSNTVSGQPHRVYGANQVEAYDVIGTAHQFPIKPGTGAEDCGSGYPDQNNGICASLYIARWFGLDK